MEPGLPQTFKQLKKLLKRYEGPFQPKLDQDDKYDLWSLKELVIAGKKRKEVYFAGLIIRSRYVGFYYMPVYAGPSLKKLFPPELLKRLRGKSCFHITALDRNLEKQVADALAKGFALYKKKGWV